jgi:toxin ParE1/3/4
MVYNLIISPRAQKEIEHAIDYYLLDNSETPKKFINSLQNTYKVLTVNPFFKIIYKNVRSLKIKRFPYSLYFEINELKGHVKVLACFHNKQNPTKRPKL